MNQSNILLESGTNELEIVAFSIGSSTYGINVLKVREIMDPITITLTPHAHPHVEGIVTIRGEVMTVIDLGKALGYPPSEDPSTDKLIISELNQVKVAFRVHSVSRIHRISWQNIEKPSQLTQGGNSVTIGVIKMESELILLLDYEKIVMDINPDAGINEGKIKELGERERSDKQILIAEDSPMLRGLLEGTLTLAGYHHLQFFENGFDAWDHLLSLVSHEKKLPDIIITDIEMPQMDGHHLTKKIKEHLTLKKLPVIIFSSLITSELQHKGERVGANAQVSKPEIANLVKLVDNLAL